ncbi:hypothetical protein PPYR_11678 [Photinus pyralis]|uniref:Sodium/solute symporter n=1 Tax=Photinus pyralis TaxID=7054 RepID=A0A1Y1LEB8_PHOPY|nr:sodium-coupled monocarboxylate transporter 2 [Photinus pyralis]XP_031349310.1 sodium-coupled monocarboxylate transporter 2 [Photinus pyralis]XP_031349311.1 sodium-coupled monocarboxylate transporter 2 [Photinus pyralis]XP_031349312.1 sodium-coupled monocarboxylate transporter 2 [Photinus pyralis]XP_031349313.1 sodium-coupled monocarboxylate transporter 2 [Photinus pyralis]XP_031349314.1 sodium-coupled monocarboxylate transporter 2 [Photinus pyralis]KAB0794839.1 hypothetical protein PPYR_11
MTREASSLVWDYLVFIIFVIATTFVAVYSRFVEGKEKTKADFVFAAGKVSMAAMMLSIARGTLGVRSFLGFPSELIYRGTTMWETIYGMVLAYPIVCYIFVPVYYSLGITSVYQYLDLRFKSRLVRCLASGTYIVRQLLNQGVTVFTPCVALNSVIGLPYWASIFGITVVSVIFTILGGLKAAILADVMQGLTMIAVSVAIIIQGCIEAGGVANVFETNINGGRLKFFNFDLDPTIRVTTTSALIGQLFMSLSILGCQQNFVQRYCSMGSQRKVTKTLMYNIPVITILFSLSWVVGMVVYAVYANCDPYKAGYIKKYDEVLPFFVEDRFNYAPGILGLFMACLFNGALSLNVSNLNSLATVTFEDFLKPIPRLKAMKDIHQLYVIKAIGVVYGFVIMGISFGVGLLSGVIESSMLVTSATSGPLLGVFFLAMLVPCCNWKGAAIGMITSHILTLWITFGGLTIDKPIVVMPLSTEGCNNSSFNPHILRADIPFPITTTQPPTTVTYSSLNITRAETSDPLTDLYSITYMYYSFIGCIITVVIGCTFSCITNVSEDELYTKNLIHPIAQKIASWCPGANRRYLEDRKLSIIEENAPQMAKEARKKESTNGTTNVAFADEFADNVVCRTKL